jgi:hypothetical protein
MKTEQVKTFNGVEVSIKSRTQSEINKAAKKVLQDWGLNNRKYSDFYCENVYQPDSKIPFAFQITDTVSKSNFNVLMVFRTDGKLSSWADSNKNEIIMTAHSNLISAMTTSIRKDVLSRDIRDAAARGYYMNFTDEGKFVEFGGRPYPISIQLTWGYNHTKTSLYRFLEEQATQD